MTIAVFSLLGMVIGASLQYIFTRHLEDQRHRRDLRAGAYMDYLRSVAELSNLTSNAKQSHISDIRMRIADAKARISLYGSPKSITAFAAFERLGAAMKTEEQRSSFIEMLHAMREDSGSKALLKTEELELVVLGDHGHFTQQGKSSIRSESHR